MSFKGTLVRCKCGLLVISGKRCICGYRPIDDYKEKKNGRS